MAKQTDVLGETVLNHRSILLGKTTNNNLFLCFRNDLFFGLGITVGCL